MGKQGPCYHCGVTSTPLWRNGPLDKPVLCNACGSRWRTKGTLANYTPLHARAEADEYEDHGVSKMKALTLKKADEKLKKRKLIYENTVVKRYASDYSRGFLKITDENTSNRSSSGSAVSNSESSAQFSSADASDLTGPAQSVVWEAQVPSKKRTCVTRTKSSPVEKLIKDLHAVLHEQQFSYLSGFSEEDLIFESDEPMVSVEIGHGSVLIKHPSSLAQEEESEASSLSVENKPSAVKEACSRNSAFLSGCNYLKGDNVRYHGNENVKELTVRMMQQKPTKRDKSNHDRMELFWTQSSPLCYIDLNDVINFEVLLEQLTNEEQQQLLKYLPSPDKSQLSGSLRKMFDSSCFKENLCYFQQLLSEGVFSKTYIGAEAEELKTLKKLALTDMTKSKWMELYTKLKDCRLNHYARETLVASGSRLNLLKDLKSTKRLFQEQNQIMPVNNLFCTDKQTCVVSKRGLSKSCLGSKEPLVSDGSFSTPRSLFGLSTDGRCIMPGSCQFPDENSDQDLLLDVPSNGFFPQAELLHPTSSLASHQISASSSSIQ